MFTFFSMIPNGVREQVQESFGNMKNDLPTKKNLQNLKVAAWNLMALSMLFIVNPGEALQAKYFNVNSTVFRLDMDVDDFAEEFQQGVIGPIDNHACEAENVSWIPVDFFRLASWSVEQADLPGPMGFKEVAILNYGGQFPSNFSRECVDQLCQATTNAIQKGIDEREDQLNTNGLILLSMAGGFLALGVGAWLTVKAYNKFVDCKAQQLEAGPEKQLLANSDKSDYGSASTDDNNERPYQP